ncbi:hypothetical protein VTL71DRAFT_14898 [Oculimacula yallundae]|uniref:Uncharacterized protein n=1 Tax=Oculimacula yallundae TaxID=86028 RepID=A0ABR4CF29_9HELO
MEESALTFLLPPSDPTMRSRRCKSWVTYVDVLTCSAIDAFEDLSNRTHSCLRARDLHDSLHDLRDRWNSRSAFETQDTYDPNSPHLPRDHVKWKLIKRFIPKNALKEHLMMSTTEAFDDMYDRANTPVRAREFHNILHDLRDRWDAQDREKKAALLDPFRAWVPPVGASSVSPPTQVFLCFNAAEDPTAEDFEPQELLCFNETQIRKHSKLFNSVLHRKINNEYGYDPDDKWSIMAFKKEGTTKVAGGAIMFMPLLRDIYDDPNKQMSMDGKTQFQNLLCRPNLTWEVLIIWHTWVETGVLNLTACPWQKERALILVDVIGARGGFRNAVKGHPVDAKLFDNEKEEERWGRGSHPSQVRS